MRAWTFFLPGVFVALSGSPALADWVNLKGGGTLIGIDLKKKGHQYAFTVETGMTTGFDNRVRSSILAAQTAIGVFEKRHA